MKLWPRSWWPHTLSSQLVVVTTAVVLVSNLAVGLWFETSQEALNQSSLTDRIADRAATTATLLSGIPAHERPQAIRAMSSGLWHFHLRSGSIEPHPMTADEAKLAQRIRGMLLPQRAKQPVSVNIHEGALPPNPAQGQPKPRYGTIYEVVLPVVRNQQVVMMVLRPPPPTWPTEVLIAGFVAFLASLVAAALVGRRVVKPLSQLAASASEAARGGPAPRVPEEGPDDIQRAARAFNAMTDQVTRTLESQRQLLSAVGHDLRTPITAMRINTEFVEDADIRARLETNIEELQELTEAVLSAARGVGWGQMRKIDLAALMESLCSDLDELGEPISWQPHPPAPFSCRPNEIRRALRNLIENAIAYGNRAKVSMQAQDAAYEIVVDDDGPGIPEADRKRVFEPFVRLEASRSSETGGSGLGLTLVKAIAEGHGGAVQLENRSEGGLRVRLSLPREALAT
ncbi:MAG TPA: ATP-binding protein [Rhizomicrobium sp.]|nr:ATP-binding protein [Rhizomicrobium sp.]